MKKLPIILLILIGVLLFAAGDYYLNNLNDDVGVDPTEESPPNIIDNTIYSIFKSGEVIGNYKIAGQISTKQIFEKIDLSNIGNITIAKNKLDNADQSGKPIFLYEIHGPVGQGSITYLNVKLQFIAQINPASETLNEDSAFGNNSFYYNDQNEKNTTYLLTQVGDKLFAFQYSREDPKVHEDVKAITQKLTSNL